MLSKPIQTDPQLLAKLQDAASRRMTPAELWRQRVSFVYGMLPRKSKITRVEVERRITEIYGPCPSE